MVLWRMLQLLMKIQFAMGAHPTNEALEGNWSALAQVSQSTRHLLQSHALLGTKAVNVENAMQTIATLIFEAGQKADLEQVQCSEYDLRQREMMEQARRDIASYDALAADARATVLSAQEGDALVKQKLPQVDAMLSTLQSKCAVDMEALQKQVDVIEADLGRMEKVANLSGCSESGASMLMQCHSRNHRRYVAFGHDALNVAAGRIQSRFAQQMLQRSLAAAFAPGDGSSSLVQRSATKRRSHRHGGRHRFLRMSRRSTWRESPDDHRKQQRKCSLSAEVNCVHMRDVLMQTSTGIADRAVQLKRDLSEASDQCQEAKHNYEAQIEDYESKQKELQTLLARALQEVSQSAEQSRLKGMEVKDQQEEYARTMSECKASLESFESDVCGMRRIRAEIVDMGKVKRTITDCEVSQWVADECPVTCDGGVQRLSRTVLVLPDGGAECPPLEMERRCNAQPCPVDCQVEPWTGWSSCTAACGGGVRQRSRGVAVAPSSGGLPCGKTAESTVCNSQGCDSDCELEEWSGWSGCSKMCDGGLQRRTRRVRTNARGAGTCPEPNAATRLEYKPCGEEACPEPQGPTLRCASKLDVLFLLDGSGSLSKTSWEAMRVGAQRLVEAFSGSPSRVGVVLFSGPTDFQSYRQCTEAPASGESGPTLEDCGVTWVSHLSDEPETVAQLIPELKWPQGTTLTSAALTTASVELEKQRPDAQAVVVVVTDGRPMSPLATGYVADSLRVKARLMWVPVTKYAPLKEAESWASLPVHENVIQMEDFATFSKETSISSLVASICPKISTSA